MGAIDQVFLTRLFVGMLIYWFFGIISKGIFEPLQAHIGRSLVSLFHNRSLELREQADKTCSEIDDLLTESLSNSLGRINQIIGGDDLPESERQLYKELVAERYQLSVLLDKLVLKQ